MHDSATFFQTADALQIPCPRCGHTMLMHRLGPCRELRWPAQTPVWKHGGFLLAIPGCSCDALMCRQCAHSVDLHSPEGCAHRTSDPYGHGEPDCGCSVPAIEIWKRAYDLGSIRRLYEEAHQAPVELALHKLHSGEISPYVREALKATDAGEDMDLALVVRAIRSVEAAAGEVNENVAKALDTLEAYASVAAALNREAILDGVPPLERVLQWAAEGA